MTSATQPRVLTPDIVWVDRNLPALDNNCWVLNKPAVGWDLIVLAPNFGSDPIHLGKIVTFKRIAESRSFWARTDRMPVIDGRYELGVRVHLIGEATL